MASASRKEPYRSFVPPTPHSFLIADSTTLQHQTGPVRPEKRSSLATGTGGCDRWIRWVSSSFFNNVFCSQLKSTCKVTHYCIVQLVVDTTDALSTVVCPVARQLLGDAFSNYGAYGPSAADVPLREWIDKACGIDPAETGFDGTGQDMGAGQGLSFGPQFGRLQGEVPHNLNAHGKTTDNTERARTDEAELEQMDKPSLIAYILRNRL